MSGEPKQGAFRHEALLYASPEEFIDGTGSFIEDGLERDEPILAVLGAEKITALRDRLGERAERVRFADMAEVGQNPARIIPAWREFVDEHSGPRSSLRGIGEPIWAERSPAELIECQRHESLLNLAFADAAGFHLLCPYDTSALTADVLEEAQRSHPHLASDGETWESPSCRTLDEIAAPFAEPLPEPPVPPDSRIFQPDTLAVLRGFVTERAVVAGLGERAVEELVLAAHEVASNSIVHGGGWGVLRMWDEGDTLICEVQDRGRIDRPLAGREAPVPGQLGGHGLWLANHICDLVQIRSYDGGSVVRMHMRRGT